MPLQQTSGAASYDAFGGGVAVVPQYIEDYFSCFLYTGNGTSQSINNGIDLAGKGGLVWGKNRSAAANNFLANTVLGASNGLISNSTGGNTFDPDRLTAFTASGFSVGSSGSLNTSGNNYVSWTWAEAPKFFDVVTYTGNGTAGRTILHSLGSTPGCIIVKRTDSTSEWAVYHRSLGATKYLWLNSAASEDISTYYWNDTTPTSTNFTVGDSGRTNASGGTYVAYLFAHNAGGFGLAGTDNVISCGSFTSSSIGLATVDLGYEPQWILYKGSNGVTNWQLVDNMRGFVVGAANSGTSFLNANTSAAEGTNPPVGITNTGFNFDGASNITYIYIAIRRGPMRTPTTGTSVFVPYAYAGSGAGTYTTGINQDLFFAKSRNSSSYVWNWYDRLRGPNLRLQSNATNAEASATGVTAFNNTSMTFGASDGFSSASPFGGPYIGYALTRAPGFFDVVCYTGTGSARTVAHNLTVAPELMIVKGRSIADNWSVLQTGIPTQATLNGTFSGDPPNATYFGNGTSYVAPTASVFSVGTNSGVNGSGLTYVAYLFASCPGVSKCLAFTGTGTLQTINCGFTSGARFVLIKRTDSTGDWYVWDSSRGLSSSNDPYLLLNSTAAEVTSTNWVDTTSTGFQVTAASGNNVNINGASYIALAIS